MIKSVLIILFILTNLSANNFSIINIVDNEAFNYFASLFLWLLIISSPMFLLISLIKFVRKLIV